MLPLCSTPLIALLVVGEVEDCSMMDRIMLGYHNITYLINAYIYLVKGGRLCLMPGVLFHSCRLSFRHTGVMFLDFAFLMLLGLWEHLDSSLWIKLLQPGPTLVLHLPNNLLPFPWVGQPKGHLYFNPPGQRSFECWSKPSSLRGHLGETRGLVLLVAWPIRCALITRYVQLLSGFVSTFGRLCWSCFTIVEMSCNRDSETNRVFLGEGISFIDRESLSWAKLGHRCRV